MRRFFFFKSSSNSNEESNRTPPVPQNGTKTPDLDSKLKRRNYTSELEISSPHLRRSLSFSSPATYYDMDDTDFHESPPIFQNSNNFANNCPIHQHMGTPERDDNFSISNSSHTSPVNANPNCIKNRANKNKYLDVYIEGEQQHQEENQSSSSDNTNKGFGLGKPPRARRTEKFKDFKDAESATSVEDIYEDTTGARAFWSNHLDCNSDEILILKAEEAEERVRVLSEESFEREFLRAKGVTAESLFKLIQDLNEERKYLARELCTQTKSRITERLNSDEKFNISKIDLLTKVNKIKSEEKRLRDRVRELAEQNVSLQREVCGLKLKEENNFERIRVYENELNSLKKENLEVNESLMEVKEKFNEAEGQLGHFRSCYKEKEEENKDLKKVIFRLNKTCSEQEKSINSLINDNNKNNNRDVDKEILRFIGVEYKLRGELESYRIEMESLRRENISLLERFKKGKDFKLEDEIYSRVDFLQNKSFCLIKESNELNIELLGFVKRAKNNNDNNNNRGDYDNVEGFNILEYSLKCEKVKKGIEGLKRSLKSIQGVISEKSCSNQTLDKIILPQGEMEVQLKSEILINKILREKLFSKEEETEQLKEELASLIRGNDLLQSEIQRLQDELSCLTYKSKDLETQVVKKEEIINQLREELQEAVKELSATRSMLKTVLEERDLASQEVFNLRNINNNLIDNNNFLSKRVESLDEDLLFKEGQISILKDGNKSLKDFLL